jgi:hypothetical protein
MHQSGLNWITFRWKLFWHIKYTNIAEQYCRTGDNVEYRDELHHAEIVPCLCN